ncbi:MAG: hypothetical protein IKY01_08105 [Prevotella sp.]|nr:hypothetical protein [Prevotella sp.]
MKKILVMVAVAMMTALSVNAQSFKHEVGVFYGFESASNVFSLVTSAISAAAGDQSSFWGPVGVEYYYNVSPVVGLGAVAAYAGCKAEDDKTHKEDLTESFITVMPSVKFNWLRKKNFGMYSALSAGAMFASVKCNDNAKAADPNAKDETVTVFMFQATALGAEFGGEQFRGFVEAGVGEKGVLCAGLRYKF